MPESHQAERIVFILCHLDKFVDVTIFVDHFQLFDDRLIGAAVERTGESGSSGRDRGVQVDLRAADDPDGGGGTILLMVGVKNKEDVEQTHRFRADMIGTNRRIEHHIEEVGAI